MNPPFWLEWLVDRATPQEDRDAIVGDLREIYRSDGQYLTEALRTIPRVVVGRAFVHLDIPSLVLQLSVIFLFAGRWGALSALPLLLLAEAYRPSQPPTMHRMIFEATAVSAAAFILLELSSIQTLTAWHVGADPDKTLALYIFLACPLIPPVVCGLSVLLARLAPSCQHLAGNGDDLQCGNSQARTQDAVARRFRTRRQLFWIGCAIPMVALHERLVKAGLTGYRPMLVEVGYVGAGILFFLGLAFSRSCTALPNLAQR